MAFNIVLYAYAIIGHIAGFSSTLANMLIYQDKYFRQKSKGQGPILLELFPFVVLNGF